MVRSPLRFNLSWELVAHFSGASWKRSGRSGDRGPPVTAHTIATLNQLYPGRVVLGLGTGNTGRRTMGLAPMNARDFRDYVRTVKGLLRGETVAYREGDVIRPIRFLHPDQGIVNLDGPIPICIAAFGPQAMRMANRKSTRLNSSHLVSSRMPSSA